VISWLDAMCGVSAMTGDTISASGPAASAHQRAAARPFIAQALAAAQKAGGRVSRSGRITPGNRSTFRARPARERPGQPAAHRRSRGRRHQDARGAPHARAAPLAAHLNYLRREGVTRDGEKARLFGPEATMWTAAPSPSAARTTGTISASSSRPTTRGDGGPQDLHPRSDGQMEKDLGTKLDWVGVDHWNTDNPHVHIIVRGAPTTAQDLVISRDYIKEGMRARARDLITQELGPRTDLDIRRAWSARSRPSAGPSSTASLSATATHRRHRHGARPGRQPDEYHALKVGRLRKLEPSASPIRSAPANG
jgi:hypothetical protein